MVFTNYGCENLKNVGFVGSGAIPKWLAIGSGSGTAVATESGLIHEYTSNRTEYDTLTSGTSREVTMTFTYGAVGLSGLTLSEFGVFSNATGGNIWNIHRLGSITFDGSIELQFDITTKINPT